MNQQPTSRVRSRARSLWWRYVTSRRVVTVPTPGEARGRVLLAYLNNAARLGRDGHPLPPSHTAFWECWTIARTWRDLGFTVDVVHFHNHRFQPRRHYDVAIDLLGNLERWDPHLPPECIRVMHLDCSEKGSKTAAERVRLRALQARQGVALEPRHQDVPHDLGHASCGTLLGNRVTAATYADALPLYHLPVPTVTTYPDVADRDLTSARTRFLWLGSRGAVLKGLDVVLEVFARNPQLHLTVCGPVEDEADFVDAYRAELYDTENIDLRGFIDITGPEFEALRRDTAALVYPTASEGQAGAVATAMQAGIIPIATPECGVDIEQHGGILLPDASVDAIEAAVRDVAAMAPEQLQQRATQAQVYARTHHTRDAYERRYEQVARAILAEHGGPAPLAPTGGVT